jgi:FAD-NAD(P)-binding
MNRSGSTGTFPIDSTANLCIVGAGPRGLSLLERICANARVLAPNTMITVHVVDPYPPGPGSVWRTNQDRHLLMNTVASQVSMFTDATVDMEGPLATGPALYDWASFLTIMSPVDGYEDWVLAEAGRLGPNSYSTRAFYGRYLEWVFARVVSQAPVHVRIRVHRRRAVGVHDSHDSGDLECLVLEDGTHLSGLHAVILAQGHLPTELDSTGRALADFATGHGLRYQPPANPADVDLSAIRPGERVALRGLGLCFFDYVAVLTEGRGGSYVRRDGHLRYLPSGREPVLYAGSRRGVPYHSRGENEKGPHGRHTPLVLTPAVIEGLHARAADRGGIDLRRDLWPLVAKEVETTYYATLLTALHCACGARRFRERYLAHPWGSAEERHTLDEFEVADEDRWDWEYIAKPYTGQRFSATEEFRDWLLRYLRGDLAAARAGNVSGPLKAALDVLRDLRNEVRMLVDHNGLTGRSHREDLDGWYTPFNAYLSIGPPASRVEEAIALIEAGVLVVVGPDLRLRADSDAGLFVLESPEVPGSRVTATTLIEARLPEPDLRRTTDPLLRQLLSTGQASAYRITDPDAYPYETGGVAVTGRPYRLVDAAGRAHPRRFAFGVPTESVHWATAAGIRPGVSSVTLTDSDAIARAALALRGGAPVRLAAADNRARDRKELLR